MNRLQIDRHPLTETVEVERNLQSLWQRARGEQSAVVRSRVLTLIVVVGEEEERRYSELLTTLAGRHPSRTLLVLVGDGDGDERFDAAVSLLCEIGRGSLCAEQIRLYARGAALARLPAAMRALFGGSLPVALWWELAPEREDRLLGPLCRAAQIVLFDSRGEQQAADLRAWSERIGTHRAADLEWERLAGWREAVARLFDPLGCLSQLNALERLNIEYEALAPRAWLLAGWLCDRLGWRLRARDAESLLFERDDGETVRVEVQEKSSGREGIGRVTLLGPETRFDLTRLDHEHLRSYIVTPDAEPLEGIGHLGHRTREEIVSALLDRMAPDPLYLRAVRMAESMSEAT